MGVTDNLITFISPAWAAKRALNRERSRLLTSSSPTTIPLPNSYGGYAGAQGGRLATPWLTSPKDARFRYSSIADQIAMRDRARDLERNNELANALLSRTTENVVGPKGFQLQVNSANPAWTSEKNKQWSEQAESLMRGWFPTADIAGLSWVEHQKTVFRSCLRDGDVGVILDKDGYLQGVEADLIVDPDKVEDDEQTIFGVAVDDYNKATGYYVQSLANGKDDEQGTTRIAAKDMILVSHITRFGQVRGETVFATIFNQLDLIAQWKLAAVVAAKVAACFGIAIKKKDRAAIYNTTTTNGLGQTQPNVNLSPGMVQYLDPEDEISSITPGQPGSNFAEALTIFIRLCGIPFGLPLEMTLLDYSKSSYSASRAAQLNANRKFQSWQTFFTDRYLKRVYQWRISKFIKLGLLEPNPDAWNHRWVSAPFPFLDPVKEMQSLAMSLDLNIDTVTDYLDSHGRDFALQTATRGAELAAMQKAGIEAVHTQSFTPWASASKGGSGSNGNGGGDEDQYEETQPVEDDITPTGDDDGNGTDDGSDERGDDAS